MFVPAEQIPHEELVRLPRKAFQQEEWDVLDEDTQEEIYENDESSKQRIDKLVAVFVGAYKYATEIDDGYRRDQVMEFFLDRLGQEGGSSIMERGKFRLYNALHDLAEENGLDTRAFDEIVDDVMSNDNLYETTRGRGDVYTEELQAYVYIDDDEWGDLVKVMYPDEILRAASRIEDETDDTIDLDRESGWKDGQRWSGALAFFANASAYEKDWDTGDYVGVDAAWSYIEDRIRERIDEEGTVEAIPAYAELEGKPATERVVYRWPDGFYVQELLAEELPQESKDMGICVGDPGYGYARAVKRGEIKIYSLRRPAGKPLFTMEIDLDDKGRISGVKQVKGKANRLPGFDSGKVGDRFPIKRDEVERLYQFIEGPMANLTAPPGVAVDDIKDVEPAVAQVNELFHKGDKWAVKLLSSLGIEPETPTLPSGEPPAENPPSSRDRCGVHGSACTGFCVPYRRTPRRREGRRNPSDFDEAMGHAERLVKHLAEHGVIAKAWGRPGVAVRVYVGRQFLSVSRGGDVSLTSRGYQTFNEQALFPDQRRSFRIALAAYRVEADRILDQRFR